MKPISSVKLLLALFSCGSLAGYKSTAPPSAPAPVMPQNTAEPPSVPPQTAVPVQRLYQRNLGEQYEASFDEIRSGKTSQFGGLMSALGVIGSDILANPDYSDYLIEFRNVQTDNTRITHRLVYHRVPQVLEHFVQGELRSVYEQVTPQKLSALSQQAKEQPQELILLADLEKLGCTAKLQGSEH